MKILTVLLAMSLSYAAYADDQTEEVRLNIQSFPVTLTINVNPQTVRCLVGGYAMSSLKITVPELKDFTRFRQTTRGETEPCINAGACKSPGFPDGLDPSRILKSNKPTEEVNFTIVQEEVLNIDHTQKTCFRSVLETVSATVRGLKFEHTDGISLETTPYDVCVQLKQQSVK